MSADASQIDAAIKTMETAFRAAEAVLVSLYAMRDQAELPSEPIALREDRSDAVPANDLIELHAAAKRFRMADDTVRYWCRTHKVGEKRRGRWWVSVSKMQARLAR